LIDTGATYVTLSAADALRTGIDYLRGARSVSQTANGAIMVYIVNFAHVQVGDIALANVPGLVVEEGAGQRMPALIGMSFLRHVEMRQAGNTLVLQRPER
jgi:aspartyl protease family protein